MQKISLVDSNENSKFHFSILRIFNKYTKRMVITGLSQINPNQNFSLNPENISVIQYSMRGTRILN